jgi:hypothetical protein
MRLILDKETIKKTAPYLAIAALTLVFLQPFFTDINKLGINDWDSYCIFDETARTTLLEYGQFPLWNPYVNGGRPYFGHPHATFLRPTFLFSLIFGCAAGLKIEMLFLVALGMIGMFLLSKHYKLSAMSGILMAAIFGLNGYFALHITEGHVDFPQLAFLPYIFLFFLKSEEPKYLIWGSILLAVTILGAPPNHGLIFIALFLGLFSLFHSIKTKSVRPLISAALIICVAAGLGAVRLIPEKAYLNEHPRYADTKGEMTSLKGLYHELADRNQPMRIKHFTEQKWDWHEYGAYIGILPLLLFLSGAAILYKKEWPLIASGIFSLILSMGDFAIYAPWNIIHYFEPFSFMRIPSRVIILFIFSAAIIAGMSTDYFLNNTKLKKTAGVIGAILILAVIVDLISVSRLSIPTAFQQPPIDIPTRSSFLQTRDTQNLIKGANNDIYLNILSNNGTLNWYDPINHPVSAKAAGEEGYLGEIYLANGENATYSYWSPNKLIAEFATNSNTTLVINQNFDPDWKARGKKIENFNGLLAVKVTPSESISEFRYMPASFILGSIISSGFIILILFSYRYLRI